jgi:BMFP domain-containing protein YqiC
MKERSRFMDDLAGVAQGAMSAFAGVRDEAEAVMRARIDDAIQRFDLVRGEQFAAVQEMAANARAAQEAAEAKLAALADRVAALEARVGAVVPEAGATTEPPIAMPPPTEVRTEPGDAASGVLGSGG